MFIYSYDFDSESKRKWPSSIRVKKDWMFNKKERTRTHADDYYEEQSLCSVDYWVMSLFLIISSRVDDGCYDNSDH